MVCTTFLNQGELNQPLPDAEIQNLLEHVRKLSGKDWQVVPLPKRRVGLFRKPAPNLYGIYVYVGGIGPWQQINFYSDESRSSLNMYVPMEVVAAYFYGMFDGLTAEAASKGDAS